MFLLNIKTMMLTVIATSLLGFTEYGNQAMTQMMQMTGNYNDYVDYEDVVEKTQEYVKLIAPPGKTHGYGLYDASITFLIMFACIAALREVMNRIFARIFRNRNNCKKYTKEFTWNLLSIMFCIIISTYGILMTKNVIWVFLTELNTLFSACGFSGFFTNCDVRVIDQLAGSYVQSSNTPYTQQLIKAMDYETHSSGVMFMCILMVAYFIYDLIVNNPVPEYIFHHILVMSCIASYAWIEEYAFYINVAMVTEFSTIFLGASSLVKRKSWMKKLLLIEFATSFFLTRLVLIAIVLGMVWLNESGMGLILPGVSFGILTVMNSYWFYLIARKVIRKCKSE
jgi:TLC domain-containing protein